MVDYHSKPFIRIRGLHKKLGWQHILRGIDLDVFRGETLCIIGPSGEGKTVTMKHVIGLMQPDEGTVEVDGIQVNGLRERELAPVRQRVSMLFQNGALFDSLTVAQNVAFPLVESGVRDKKEIKDRVTQALEIVGLGQHGDKLPVNLSGGMRKRAGIARALALDPPILFFDEPSAGLDPVTAAELDQLIQTLARDLEVTIVMVTHELASIMQVVDQCIMLDRAAGGIIARGAPHELADRSTDLRVQAFFRRQPLARTP